VLEQKEATVLSRASWGWQLQEWAAAPLWHGNWSQRPSSAFFLPEISLIWIEGQSFTSVGWRPAYSSCSTPSLLKLFLWRSYRDNDQGGWFFSLGCHNLLCFFLPLSSFILIWSILHNIGNNLLIQKGLLALYCCYDRKHTVSTRVTHTAIKTHLIMPKPLSLSSIPAAKVQKS